MLAQGVIVLEKQTCWEAELKRGLADDSVQVRACRLPAQVPGILAAMPASVLVLHLEVGPADCLRLVAKAVEITPPICIVVLAPASLAELEWASRDLGAAEFLHEPLTGPQLAKLCRRLLGPRESAHPSIRSLPVWAD